MKYFYLFLFIFFFSFVSAELNIGYDLEDSVNNVVLNVPISPLNQSSLNVNNSQYLQGYTPLTLRTWMEDHFDLVYAPLSSLANYLPLTGGTMSGDINMGGKDISNADTINATSFIGNGSQLTDVGYWNRTGTVLSPKTSGDDITTTGDIYTENLYNNGNVGIGTTTPDEALDVVGNINIASSSAYMYDGVNALKLDKNGEAVYYSTLVGVNAGNAGNVNSTKQTAIGSYAGYENSGTSQTAIGYAAGYSNSGNQQAAIGYYAGYSNSGNQQAAIGYYAGLSNSGTSQAAIGSYAGLSNSGTSQTAIGYYAGLSNSGNQQAAIGSYAGYSNSGNQQAAIGYAAGYSNSGDRQAAIGYNAGYENEGNQVIGIGYEATRDNEGNDVVAIGYQAGKANTVANQFIVKQANINAVPLIQGDFVTGDVSMAQDNAKLLLGTAQDSSIYYDGTDMVINPAEVGSGSLKVLGDINATGYIGNGSQLTDVGYWNRTGTVLSPKTSGDDITTTGKLTAAQVNTNFVKVGEDFGTTPLGTSLGTITGNVNGISGINMKNLNTGTSADFRFFLEDTTNSYLAFFMPSINNNLNIFGNPRKHSTGLFTSSSTVRRDLVLGTIQDNDIILGTQNTERMRITNTLITMSPQTLFKNKIMFTQIDGNEYIDSLADGYMDYGATTGHRFNADIQTTGSVKGVHKTADGTSAVADGEYVMGIGATTNGTITIKDGLITAVTEAVN